MTDQGGTPRADRQTAPLVVGQFYLVPTVRAKWFNREWDWPILGPLHNDADFFAFTEDHYHVDARFLSPSRWREPALGSIQPVDGVITCPLHGLRIDAATGRCLEAKS